MKATWKQKSQTKISGFIGAIWQKCTKKNTEVPDWPEGRMIKLHFVDKIIVALKFNKAKAGSSSPYCVQVLDCKADFLSQPALITFNLVEAEQTKPWGEEGEKQWGQEEGDLTSCVCFVCLLVCDCVCVVRRCACSLKRDAVIRYLATRRLVISVLGNQGELQDVRTKTTVKLICSVSLCSRFPTFYIRKGTDKRKKRKRKQQTKTLKRL